MYQNRRGIQFSVKDTWSLDATLNPILLSALRKFKEVITAPERKDWVGVPSLVLFNLYPDHKEGHTDEQLQIASDEWVAIIDKMIYAFDVKNEPKLKDYAFSFNHDKEESEDGLIHYKITTTNEEEYNRYKEDEALYNKRVEEGLKLFSQYYLCLWW